MRLYYFLELAGPMCYDGVLPVYHEQLIIKYLVSNLKTNEKVKILEIPLGISRKQHE